MGPNQDAYLQLRISPSPLPHPARPDLHTLRLEIDGLHARLVEKTKRSSQPNSTVLSLRVVTENLMFTLECMQTLFQPQSCTVPHPCVNVSICFLFRCPAFSPISDNKTERQSLRVLMASWCIPTFPYNDLTSGVPVQCHLPAVCLSTRRLRIWTCFFTLNFFLFQLTELAT